MLHPVSDINKSFPVDINLKERKKKEVSFLAGLYNFVGRALSFWVSSRRLVRKHHHEIFKYLDSFDQSLFLYNSYQNLSSIL